MVEKNGKKQEQPNIETGAGIRRDNLEFYSILSYISIFSVRYIKMGRADNS